MAPVRIPGAGLSLSGVSKRFGKVQALQDVSLDFLPGEVHAVLGENGAGKSTLVSIVAGLVAPDSGEVFIDGREIPWGDPVAATNAGVGVVHQHFTLVPDFTVEENIALFRLNRRSGRFNIRRLAEPALAKGRELRWELDGQARARDLSVGAQQRVEILKSLRNEASVLVFDEPTAPLGGEEVEELLQILRQLAGEGKVVILVAHKLKEVFAVADKISVLRHGQVVAANLDPSSSTAESLATLMVGDLPPALPLPAAGSNSNEVVVSHLSVLGDLGEQAVRGVDFTAAAGRIFGIGGVDGNGQVELAEALAGLRRFEGSITFNGEPLADVAYIPADRQTDGLALSMSVLDNLLLGRLDSWPRRSMMKPWADGLVRDFDVKTSGVDQAVDELSGGNQQKLIVARTLGRSPMVVVAVNPARGLDVKATAFVYSQLREASNRGAVVILILADTDELYSVADDIVFMGSGRLEASGNAALGGTT